MKNTICSILTVVSLLTPDMISAANAAHASDIMPEPETSISLPADTVTAADSISEISISEVALTPDSISEIDYSDFSITMPGELLLDSVAPLNFKPFKRDTPLNSIYAHPYSVTGRHPDWHRLWINTAVLGGAFVGTLFVLEMLPEDATTWNRAALQKVPLFKRWREHVITEGPEWDHDRFIFNYVLHPYAGAAYYMAARSNGFNAWQSLLYSAAISTIGWEFGIEAFMERPSIQDIFITPLVGSLIGEGFYKLKRKIVSNGYTLAGTPILGNVVAFLIDPVNEVVGLFNGNPARKLPARKVTRGAQPEFTSSLQILSGPTKIGLSMMYTF